MAHSSASQKAEPIGSWWMPFGFTLQWLSRVHALWLILAVTMLQGILYIVFVPPWQHYDEPTHFEYAWLIAHETPFPSIGDEDPSMRREVLSTLFASGFFRRTPPAALLVDEQLPWLGITELEHMPVYYAIVALPLRLFYHFDVYTQLYAARSVSLVFFLLTIAMTYGLMRELVPRTHPLVWAVPLGVAFLPPFADTMTSVNNDVGAAWACMLCFWGCVRLVRRGLHPYTLLWVAFSVVLALSMKNTAIVAVPASLLAFAFACLLHFPRFRPQWFALASAVLLVAFVAASVGWGDAAAWYRWSAGEPQQQATQVARTEAPFGEEAFQLEAAHDSSIRQLSSPIYGSQLSAMSGKVISVGAWIWSDQTEPVGRMGIRYTSWSVSGTQEQTQLVPVTAQPTFASFAFQLPLQLRTLSVVFYADLPEGQQQVHFFFDGTVAAVGEFATATPQFTANDLSAGTWGGKPFTNLVRNPSAEETWPRLQPWLDHMAYAYIHRSPAQVFTSLIDLPRVGQRIATNLLPIAFDSFLAWFGWTNARLDAPGWVIASRIYGLVMLVSSLVWLVFGLRQHSLRFRYAILVLACAGGLAWLNVLLRPLPLLGESDAVPIARYTFPAVVASMLVLVGGLWVLVPPRLRQPFMVALMCVLFALNIVCLRTIYQTYI